MTKPRKTVRKKRRPAKFTMQVKTYDKTPTTVGDMVAKEIEVRQDLARKLAAAPVPVRHEVQQPKTWWDHFKHEIFPSWLKDRWPIDYETHVWFEPSQTEAGVTTAGSVTYSIHLDTDRR